MLSSPSFLCPSFSVKHGYHNYWIYMPREPYEQKCMKQTSKFGACEWRYTYLHRKTGASPLPGTRPDCFRLSVSSLNLVGGRTSQGPWTYPAITVTQRSVSITYNRIIKLICPSTWILQHDIKQHNKTKGHGANAITKLQPKFLCKQEEHVVHKRM